MRFCPQKPHLPADHGRRETDTTPAAVRSHRVRQRTPPPSASVHHGHEMHHVRRNGPLARFDSLSSAYTSTTVPMRRVNADAV